MGEAEELEVLVPLGEEEGERSQGFGRAGPAGSPVSASERATRRWRRALVTLAICVAMVAAAGVGVPVRSRSAFSAPIEAIAWSGDSARLFWVNRGVFGANSDVATRRVGEPANHPLRAVGLSLQFPLFCLSG